MNLYLAGAETLRHFRAGVMTGHNSFLFSNFHRKNLDMETIINSKMNAMMDSGVFTMMFGAGKGKEYNEKDLMEYAEKYIADMHSMKRPGTIVEMDIHKVLGLDSLKRFRKLFEKKRGIENTLFVYHIEEGVEGIDELARKYPYIAIGCPEMRKIYKNKATDAVLYYLQRVKKANPQCKVHLLGCTKMSMMQNDLYYSCDSTSRLSQNKFGGFSMFDGKKGKVLKKHATLSNRNVDLDPLLRDYFGENSEIYIQSKGVNNYDKHILLSAYEFSLMEKYINRRFFKIYQ